MNTLLEKWVPSIYRFALRLSNDSQTAEDLTQETFLRAWRRRRTLQDARAARAWLFRITANLWRDQLRRNRSPVARAGFLEDDEPGSTHPPERMVAGKEDLARALKAMDALPSRQRHVLYLSACEGLASGEIAEILDISPDAVKANLSLARKKMRLQLCDSFPGATPVG